MNVSKRYSEILSRNAADIEELQGNEITFKLLEDTIRDLTFKHHGIDEKDIISYLIGCVIGYKNAYEVEREGFCD